MLSETVYYSDVSDDPRSAGLSPRVAALANNFFDELQVLINAYGNEAVDRLTPMIVSVLENLDNAFSESHDYLIKLEEVDEDKQQLLAQYEREKQLRKIAEEVRLIQFILHICPTAFLISTIDLHTLKESTYLFQVKTYVIYFGYFNIDVQ